MPSMPHHFNLVLSQSRGAMHQRALQASKASGRAQLCSLSNYLPCARHPRTSALKRPVLVTRAATAPISAQNTDAATVWPSFAENASGEWEGVTASFSPTGQPQPLPEHYVPEAFREWGVELWDWQSQCSSLATLDTTGDASSRQLRSVVRRLMPTVGCEADAIAFTEEDAGSSSSSGSSSSGSSGSSSSGGNSPDPGLVFTADGSYNSGPAVLAPISKDDGLMMTFQVEHCFMLPAELSSSSSSSSSSNRVRVKVVQQFRRDWSTGSWMLAAVDLHKERFDGPYTGKRELAGCGGGQPGIAQLPALQQQQLTGRWEVQQASATSSSSNNSSSSSSSSNGDGTQQQQPSRLSGLDDQGEAAAGVQLALLPLHAWSAVQLDPAGQLCRAEAGVLLEHPQQQPLQGVGAEEATGSSSAWKQRVVSVRSYDSDSGRLQTASIGVEQKVG